MKNTLRRFFYSAAPRAYYSILLNSFGFNVIRTVFYNLLWRIKNKSGQNFSDPAIEALEKDGVVVIENFLSKEDYSKLMDLYEKGDMVDKYGDNPSVPQYKYRQISTPLKLYDEELSNIILNNERLRTIITATSRKKINVYPKMTLEQFYASNENQLNGASPDHSDVLHYDVPFNSMRAFLYIKPCDKDTAAFIYGKGTHKFSKKRLKFEYFDSIKQSVKRRAFRSAPLDFIDEDLLGDIGYEPSHLEGKGNTLVIFNSMGVHKRGKFHKIGGREALLIDYRTLDTPLNFVSGMPVIGTAFKRYLKRFV